jgi:hypothetical protein
MDSEEEEKADKQKEIQRTINMLIKTVNKNNGEGVEFILELAKETFPAEFTQIINGKYSNGLRRNALMYASASENGNLEIVKLLLDNGAAVNGVDSTGMTALMLAAERGHLQIVILLLDNGAAVNDVDSTGMTALMLAAERGHLQIVILLLDNGAAVNDVDSTGMTALMLAAEAGHLQIVILLLNSGANIYNKTTVVGEGVVPINALEFAIENGHTDVAEVLDKWDETKAIIPLQELNVLSELDPSSFIDMKEYSRGGKRKRTQKKRKQTKRKQTKRKQTKRYKRKH